MSDEDYMTELLAISRYAGERFDLIQAGGGNSSIKTDHGLLVKASGLALSQLKSKNEFCCVDWRELALYVNSLDENMNPRQMESEANAKVAATLAPTANKPSIETLMHCLMNRLTLHTHPVSVATIACRPNYQSLFAEIFENPICVDYQTPGAALAVAIDRKLTKANANKKNPIVVFLQNHGLIVSAQTASEVIQTTESVNDQVANFLKMDLSQYKLAQKVAATINKTFSTDLISHLCEDHFLLSAAKDTPDALMSPPATPDQLVYCGPSGFFWDESDEKSKAQKLQEYFERHKAAPKVVIADSGNHLKLILLGATLHKCRDIEDVLKAHCLTLTSMQDKARLLPESEVAFLSNWDAEKYRQKL